MNAKMLLAFGIICTMLLPAIAFSDGPGCAISVYTDKPLYLPDERIYIYGKLSQSCAGGANTDLGIEITNPYNNRIYVDQKKTDSYSTYTATLTLPHDATKGTYEIAVSTRQVSGSKTFIVGPYPDILIISTDKTKYVVGEKILITGRLMKAGVPAKNIDVALTVKDSKNNNIYVSQKKTDTLGSFNDTFQVTPPMPSGLYSVYAAQSTFISEIKYTVYPSIVINEIMFNPPGDNPKEEYIELYNTYSDNIDLTGSYIKDSSGRKENLASISTAVLSPGSFAIVTASSTILSPAIGVIHLKAGSKLLGGLSNTGDTISIFDKNDVMLDSFTYRNTYGSDRNKNSMIDSSGEGSSLERIYPYGLTDYYANWNSSIGSPTAGRHNTVYRGFNESNITLLFADMPRYAMSGKDIEMSVRAKNSANMYDLALLTITRNGTKVNSDSMLLDPKTYADSDYHFNGSAGDFVMNFTMQATGDKNTADNTKKSDITFLPPVMSGPKVIELYTLRLLQPAIVPRGSSFQIIAVLTNDYDAPINNINVTLALPQAGGFTTSGPLTKTLTTIPKKTVSTGIVYNISASSAIPDEMLGKRTFSAYTKGITSGNETRDATFKSVDMINHSSPVLSLDLNLPREIEEGTTYNVVGAAFNSGTEEAKNVIITLDAKELDTGGKNAFVIDTLAPSSFEMFSFDVTGRNSGDYGISLVIKDQDGNSYQTTGTLHVISAPEPTPAAEIPKQPRESGSSSSSSSSSSSGSSSGSGSASSSGKKSPSSVIIKEIQPANATKNTSTAQANNNSGINNDDNASAAKTDENPTANLEENPVLIDSDATSGDTLVKTGSSQDASTAKSTPTGNIFGATAAQTVAVVIALVLLVIVAFGAKKLSP